MKSRERILNTFSGERTDRIPVSPFIWLNYINEILEKNYSLDDEIIDVKLHGIYRDLGFDSMIRTCTMDMISPVIATSGDWRVSTEELASGGNKRSVITTIRTPERELRGVVKHDRVNAFTEVSAETEHFIKDEEDFACFLKYQPPVPDFDCSRVSRTKEKLGDDGVVAPWLPSIFNTLSRLRKLDDLICDALVNQDFFFAMMEYYCERTVRAAIQLARVSDIVTYEGNIANGSMVGPDYFIKYLLPYEKRVIDAIKANGAYVLFHNCGDCDSMFGAYNLLGIDALETLTPPPFGDADVDHAIRILDQDMTILGNIDQIEFLRTAKSREVHDRAKELILKFKKRGKFILATSDYLSNGTPHENLKELLEAAIQYGSYE